MAISKLTDAMLPHERVSHLVRHYGSREIQIQLKDLGIGDINRSISWKYVHAKLRQIVEVEGFSSFRYKHAIAIEPRDSDPLAASRRIQTEAANSGGMLPTVDDRARYGLLTKNHLLLVLLVLKDGRRSGRTTIKTRFGQCRRKMGVPGTKSCTMY